MAVAATPETKFETEIHFPPELRLVMPGEIPPADEASEQHGISLSSARALGRAVLHFARNNRSISPESSPEYDSAKADFITGVAEGLSTDAEYKELLKVARFNRHRTRNGKVLSLNNRQFMEDVCQNGVASAQKAAKSESKMETQVKRARNDRLIAQKADAMASGKTTYNTFFAVSTDPSEAIEKDGEEFWKKVGYEKGLGYIQMYHFDETSGEILTGGLSFNAEDKDELMRKLAELGIKIPEGTSTDDYILRTLDQNMTKSQAVTTGLRMQKAIDQDKAEKLNTIDIIEANQKAFDRIFESMFVPNSTAVAARQKTTEAGFVVQGFMNNSKHYNPEIRRHLMKLINSEKFNDDDGRLIYKLIIYSAIEAARSSIVKEKNGYQNNLSIKPIRVPGFSGLRYEEAARLQYIQNIAMHGANGAASGREYTACGGGLNPSAKKAIEAGQTPGSLQEPYGGNAEGREKENSEPKYDKDSLKCVNCPACKTFHDEVKKDKDTGKFHCKNRNCILSKKNPDDEVQEEAAKPAKHNPKKPQEVESPVPLAA